MNNTIEENEDMLNDCMERERKFSEWEQNFIDSLSSYMDKGGFLSERQEDTLERIWNRVTT